jgi:hypothetical protein
LPLFRFHRVSFSLHFANSFLLSDIYFSPDFFAIAITPLAIFASFFFATAGDIFD